ncbi:MAG: hypothetical protein SFZ23_14440 [Planctomycetota bacterium]|nr:hypothetical protein [Planctomycetota bacterium]
MRTRHVGWLCVVGAASLATSSALAQVGTATFTWQASADGGQAWQSNLIEVDQSVRDLRVRGWLDWSANAGVAVETTSFDCIVQTESLSDQISEPYRPEPFSSFPPQSLASTRFGNVIKIDDVRDTLPPGVGIRGILIAQPWADSGFPHTDERPLSLLEYSLRLSGELGDRTVSSEFLWLNSFDVRLWISRTGREGANAPLTTTVPLTIRVIPAPGAAAFMTLGMLAAARRRR